MEDTLWEDGFVLLAVAVTCTVSWRVSGFGSAILFHVGVQAASLLIPRFHLTLPATVVLYRSMATVLSPLGLWAARKDWSGRLLLLLAPGIVTASLGGVEMLRRLPSEWLTTSLGVIFFLFALWRLATEVRSDLAARRASLPIEHVRLNDIYDDVEDGGSSDDGGSDSEGSDDGQVDKAAGKQAETGNSRVAACLDTFLPLPSATHFTFPRSFSEIPRKIIAATVGASLVSGVLIGMAGTGGPPLMILITAFSLDGAQFRATLQMLGFFDNTIIALYMVLGGGFLDLVDVRLLAFPATGALLGYALGTPLVKHVSQRLIVRMLLVLLVLASVVMLGLPVEVMLATVATIVVVAFALRLRTRSA